jgi:hypothetical protein
MRILSSVTSISWIPSEAVEGLPKLPFTMGVAHYDYPPPDRIDHLETMHRADLFREANELQAWIEVEDGKITELGPGAIVGERAQLENGTRTATLRAKTAGKVVGIPGEELNRDALEQVAAGHRREEG